MRLVILSDTHSLHGLIKVPNGDVLIHCGDLCGRGSIEDVRNFDRWLGTLPHKYKIIIAGNHDIAFESQNAGQSICNAIYLQDSGVEIDGLKFYGSPWQPEFFNWSFNLPRGKPLQEKWNLIPDDVDILITHGPPHGILDECPDIRPGHGNVHAGCEELMMAVRRVNPIVHCFGHIHEGYGRIKIGQTLFVNASICTGRYQPVNPVQVVDLNRV